MATQPSANALTASVGTAPATNQRDDVLQVQRRLNAAGAGISEDADCGPATLGAIRDYQRNFLTQPDGRVDPGGLTWRHLLAGTLQVKRLPLVRLPQASGLGYYSYSPSDHQFGTSGCIQALQEVCVQFARNLPDLRIGIGDISLAAGGHMRPHQSHRQGLHVDLRPLRADKKRMPVTIADAQYSRDSTALLVKALRAHRNVKAILFNDTHIAGVASFPGHDNHLHVTMKE